MRTESSSTYSKCCRNTSGFWRLNCTHKSLLLLSRWHGDTFLFCTLTPSPLWSHNRTCANSDGCTACWSGPFFWQHPATNFCTLAELVLLWCLTWRLSALYPSVFYWRFFPQSIHGFQRCSIWGTLKKFIECYSSALGSSSSCMFRINFCQDFL